MSESSSRVAEELRERLKKVFNDSENLSEHDNLMNETAKETFSEERLNVTAKRKHVQFSSEVDNQKKKDSNTKFKKQKMHNKKDSYKIIGNIWDQLSQKKEYEQLKRVLFDNFNLNEQTMRDFFCSEGTSLLMRAILWGDSDSLQFLCENVPKDALRDILRQKSYSVINSLLDGHLFLEKKAKVDLKVLEKDVNKFKLLLEIDFEGLERYINAKCGNNSSSEVENIFRRAILQFQSQTNPLKNN